MAYYFKDCNESLQRAVWAKGKTATGYDPAVNRQDMCGAWMRYRTLCFVNESQTLWLRIRLSLGYLAVLATNYSAIRRLVGSH